MELIQEANQGGARLSKACGELNISVRTYERWVEGGKVKEDQRPLAERKAPANKLSPEERAKVLETIKLPEYVDLPPSQIVPALADIGEYLASESTFYRIMREDRLQSHRGRKKAPSARKEPATHVAFGPNEVWTWDITWLRGPARGLYFKLYLIIDIFSRKIVGWEVWEEENGEYAKELVRRAALKEQLNGKPLILHSDNGSPMKAETLHTLLETLNIQKSFSRPRVSNDNPYSESMFATLKYRPQFPHRGFETVEAARKWVHSFVDWYNNTHKHSGINFVTPQECHTASHYALLKNRDELYRQAKERNPERWTRSTRNWSPRKHSALNPLKEEELQALKQEKGII